MDQGIEIWKEINGFDGDYFVSNLGRIKSYKVSSNGKILKSNTNKLGYVYFSLTKNCVLRSFTIHRLVALAFIHNSENKPQVNHINGIKNCNNKKNLEWCSASENVSHSFKFLGRKGSHTGLLGSKNKQSKKVLQYSKDLKLIKEWDSMADVYRDLKISTWAISACCKNIKSFDTAGGFIWRYK